jgi:hypothetical protein
MTELANQDDLVGFSRAVVMLAREAGECRLRHRRRSGEDFELSHPAPRHQRQGSDEVDRGEPELGRRAKEYGPAPGALRACRRGDRERDKARSNAQQGEGSGYPLPFAHMSAPNPKKQRAALAKLDQVFADAANTWIIHYSCESF